MPSCTEKRCPGCNVVKLADDFHVANGRPSGLTTYCKICSSLRKAKKLRRCRRCKILKPAAVSHFQTGRHVCKNCDLLAEVKQCEVCHKVKPLKSFCVDKKRFAGRCGTCTACRKAEHEKNGTDWRLRRTYGITKQRYDEILASQDARCAICEKTETKQRHGRTIPLMVDHDHSTGQVRGLLCHACNLGIGHLADDPKILRSAIKYLERTSVKPNR